MSGFKEERPVPLKETTNNMVVNEWIAASNDNNNNNNYKRSAGGHGAKVYGTYGKNDDNYNDGDGDDGDDDFGVFDFEPKAASELTSSSFDDSVSEFASEQHSFVNNNNNRANPRPNTRRHYNQQHHTRNNRRRNEEAEEGGEGDEGEEGDMIDGIDKETKFEKTINYVSEDLQLSKLISGEKLKTSERQKKLIREFNDNSGLSNNNNNNANGSSAGAVNDNDKEASNHNEEEEMRNKYRNMVTGRQKNNNNNNNNNKGDFDLDDDDDNDNNDNDDLESGDGSESYEKSRKTALMHMNCQLCKNTSIQADSMDRDFYDAYCAIVDLDLEKTCYAHDAQIFKEMAVVFNAQQKYIKENGGTNCFTTTPEEIRNHFMWHDTSNPLRPLNEELQELREIRRRGRRHLFGKANGRNYWNKASTKIYLQVVKQEQALINNISLLRHNMNLNPRGAHEWRGGKGSGKGKSITGGGGGGGGAMVSRHLAGATKKGRYANEYSR